MTVGPKGVEKDLSFDHQCQTMQKNKIFMTTIAGGQCQHVHWATSGEWEADGDSGSNDTGLNPRGRLKAAWLMSLRNLTGDFC